MSIAIYTLTSPLHNEAAVKTVTQEFLGSLNIAYSMKGADYHDYGSSALSLIYVRTGGTEGVFSQLLPQLQRQSSEPFYLLTSGKSNSLAASMEILSFLRQKGLKGEILHGSPEYIRHRIALIAKVGEARRQLRGARLGIVGQPSDWLISSVVDGDRVRERFGIELVPVPMGDLLLEFHALKSVDVQDEVEKFAAHVAPLNAVDAPAIQKSLGDAMRLYIALKKIAETNGLQGLTIRCFDLLTAVHNTGCIALARLNSEGYVAGCEGDVPALVSMCVLGELSGKPVFMANPSSIDTDQETMVFAFLHLPHQTVTGS